MDPGRNFLLILFSTEIFSYFSSQRVIIGLDAIITSGLLALTRRKTIFQANSSHKGRDASQHARIEIRKDNIAISYRGGRYIKSTQLQEVGCNRKTQPSFMISLFALQFCIKLAFVRQIVITFITDGVIMILEQFQVFGNF